MAVNYEDVQTLQKVQGALELTFPLLSDVGSKTIDAYGIRNLEAAGSRIDGVPYPTTFIINTDGKIKAVLGFEGHSKRHGGEDILLALSKILEK